VWHAFRDNAYRILAGIREGKWSLEATSRRWENNVKIDIREIGRKGEDQFAPVESSCEHCNEPAGSVSR
jgi:hypothetical protein